MVAVAMAGVLLRPVGFPSALQRLQAECSSKNQVHIIMVMLICYNTDVNVCINTAE